MEIPGIIDVNGEYKYVSSKRDLCDIIEKHCGHEVANIVATICNNCDAAQAYAEQKVFTDIVAYEEDLNEWNTVGECIKEALSEYEKYDACHKNLDRDRINEMKTKIRSLLDEVM